MADKKNGGKKPEQKKTAASPENNVEIFDDGEIITLYDDKEKPVNFTQVACVEYEGNLFVLLQPAEKLEGIAEDEVVIFKLEEGKDNDMFVPVDSEETLNRVFEQYLKAAADDESCGCGCDDEDCEGCGHDHGDNGKEEDECGCGCGHGHTHKK